MDVVIRRSLIRDDSKKKFKDGTYVREAWPLISDMKVVFNAGTHYPRGLNFDRNSLKVTRNLKAVIYRDEEGFF